MNMQFYKLAALSVAILGLAACSSQPVAKTAVPVVVINAEQATGSAATAESEKPATAELAALSLIEMKIADFKVEDAKWLQAPVWPKASILLSGTNGLRIVDEKLNSLTQLGGKFGSVDYRSNGQQLLLATIDLKKQQVALLGFNTVSQHWQAPVYIPKRNFKADGICLYQDESQHQFAFLVGEEGIGEQWLVASQAKPLAMPQLVRRLSFPPQSEYCAVDDLAATLYINEEQVGLWAYDADAEADLVRRPVDIRQPFGGVRQSLAGMALTNGAVVALDPEQRALYRYGRNGSDWNSQPALSLANMEEPKHISIKGTEQHKQLLLVDDNGALFAAALDWQTPAVKPARVLPVIPAEISTDLVPSLGDAADDPAIWINPKQPTQSRVLGTDKQGGLQVFDLKGKSLQYLPVGRLNNVDVRQGVVLGSQRMDIAVATNRDHNSLHVFAINPDNGQVSALAELPTTLQDIYGICLFKDAQGEVYAFPNSKDGTFIQYHLRMSGQQLQASEVRRFSVKTQPEACVVDDASQRLFVGEEDHAVWVLDARADVKPVLEKVIAVGDAGNWVYDDIEGVGFYRSVTSDAGHNYLVISSQGNNSFVVLDAEAPYQVRGAFRIGLNIEKGFDAVSETDGLAVSSTNLGAAWQQGLLVVQDGRKRMPEGNQNYKYVPWAAIARALNLP